METIKKPPKTNLIVNYLPPDMTDKELYDLFVVHGKIDYHKIIRDKATGIGLGYGFVDFSFDISAEAARRGRNGYEFKGKRLKVEYARPREPEYTNTNLFVSFLRRSVTEEQLRSLFGRYGRIIQLKILVDKATGKSRGMAFVRFERRADAQKAVDELHMRHKIKGCKRPITVQFSKQRFQPDRNALPVDKVVEHPSGFYAEKDDEQDEPWLGEAEEEELERFLGLEQEQEHELKSEEKAEEQKSERLLGLPDPKIEEKALSQKEDDPDELPPLGNTSSKLLDQFKTFCEISCDNDDYDWVGEAEEEEPERFLGLPELEIEGKALFPEMQEQKQELKTKDEAEEEWLNAEEMEVIFEWSGLMEEIKISRDEEQELKTKDDAELEGLKAQEVEDLAELARLNLMVDFMISSDDDDDWVEDPEEEKPERLLGLPELEIEGKALFPEMQEQEQELMTEEEAEEEWLNALEVEDLFEWSELMEKSKIPRDDDDDSDWLEDFEEENPERLRGLPDPEIVVMSLFPYPEPEMEVEGYELDFEAPLSGLEMLLLMLQVVLHLYVALLKLFYEVN